MTSDNGSARTHVLVVDDDRLVLTTLVMGLRQAGYSVSEATGAEGALLLARAVRPDIALLDVRMPGMSGIDLAKQLWAEARIPFLFLTAYGDPDLVKQAVEYGALGYLVKPIDPPKVVPAIEAALGRAIELRKLHEREEQLSHALAKTRETSVVVGILMERNHLSREEAFDLLRGYARSQRRKVDEVAAELLGAAELLNLPPFRAAGHGVPAKQRAKDSQAEG